MINEDVYFFATSHVEWWPSMVFVDHDQSQFLPDDGSYSGWETMILTGHVPGATRCWSRKQWWILTVNGDLSWSMMFFRLSAILDQGIVWFLVVNDSWSWSWWMIVLKSSSWLIIVDHDCWRIITVDHGSWWFLVSNDGWAWSMSPNDDCDSQLWWTGDPYF